MQIILCVIELIGKFLVNSLIHRMSSMAKQIKITSFFEKVKTNEENGDISLVTEFVTDEDESLVGEVIKFEE